MAISAASYQGFSEVAAGQYRVKVQFTDLALPAAQQVYTEDFPAQGTTQAEIQANLRRQVAAKIGGKDIGTILAGIVIGTNIPLTAPAAPATTALEVWLGKVALIERLRLRVTNQGNAIPTTTAALQARINALATDIEGSRPANAENSL